MKRYEGRRVNGLPDVRVDGVPLNPRLDLQKQRYTGFDWGFLGTGPSQLALALLADCLDDEDEADSLHQDFASAVVAGLASDGWILTDEEIRETLDAMEND